MIDLEMIRREVAKKHNIHLGENDPLFITVTLNKIIIEAYIKLIANHYSQVNREITNTLQRQLAQSKEISEHVIIEIKNSLLKEIKQTLDQIIQEQKLSLKNCKTEMVKNIELTNNKDYITIYEIINTLKRCIIFSIAISSITLIVSFFLIIIMTH